MTSENNGSTEQPAARTSNLLFGLICGLLGAAITTAAFAFFVNINDIAWSELMGHTLDPITNDQWEFKLLTTLASAIFIAIIVERAGRVGGDFLTGRQRTISARRWDTARRKERERLLKAIDDLSKIIRQMVESSAQATSQVKERQILMRQLHAEVKAMATFTKDARDANTLLADSEQRSGWIVAALSILFAVSGVRLLSMAGISADGSKALEYLFQMLDIIVSAMAIAGGGAGLRALIDRFAEISTPDEPPTETESEAGKGGEEEEETGSNDHGADAGGESRTA